jgi:hypothetical protein
MLTYSAADDADPNCKYTGTFTVYGLADDYPIGLIVLTSKTSNKTDTNNTGVRNSTLFPSVQSVTKAYALRKSIQLAKSDYMHFISV